MKPCLTQRINFISDKTNFANDLKEKFYIAECNFGKGLFAKRDIRKGEVIFKFTGKLIDFNQTVNRQDNFGDPLQIGKNLYINLEEPMRFINHSCNPNTGIKNDIILIALENIRQGEELYFDYSTTMDEEHWIMQCKCGNTNCRKIIKDFKYLSYQVQQKYLALNIVQNFIASQYQETASKIKY